MRIEQLKDTPDRAGRYTVLLENGQTMRLYRQTIEDFGLYSGLELTEQTFLALRTAAEKMSAKMRAVRIISATNVSKRDLEKRLVMKGEAPQQAKEAVRWLEDMNLLDDRKTAEQIVHSAVSRGYGLARARQMLYEKQIPKGLWDDVLSDYPEQEERIAEYLKAKLNSRSDQREIKKAVDALIRRGHSYGTIRRVLNDLPLDTDDFPEEC